MKTSETANSDLDSLLVGLAKSKKKTKEAKDEIQVTVSLDSERQLQKLLEKANDGFDTGKVTRKQILNYIINEAALNFTEQSVIAVRRSILSDMMLWDRLIKEVKSTGVVPDALREFLWKSSNLEAPIKSSKKSRQSKYINDIHGKEGINES